MTRLLTATAMAALITLCGQAEAITLDKAVEDAEEKSVVDFKGMGFGVGIGLSKDIDAGHVVQQAQVINGIIRATERRSDIPRVLLETHYFWVPTKQDRMGWGPFVAVQSGSGEVIDAISSGLMVGFRRTKAQVNIQKNAQGQQTTGEPEVHTDSFNLGLGFVLDSRAKILRDGLYENKPIPSGEEGSPLTRESSRWGLAILFSFSFL